jgi:hypothetical protein
MQFRRLALSILVLALVAAGCGDDDSGSPGQTAAAPSGSTSGATTGNGDTPAPSAAGGFLMLGDERIDFDSARCFLEEQDAAAGGGSILATGQGFGTNAEGIDVAFDFTRFSEESMFAGDDINVTIGDPFAGETVNYTVSLDIGAVSIEGNRLSASGFALESFDTGTVVSVDSEFELNC